jgi:hypothetical protein
MRYFLDTVLATRITVTIDTHICSPRSSFDELHDLRFPKLFSVFVTITYAPYLLLLSSLCLFVKQLNDITVTKAIRLPCFASRQWLAQELQRCYANIYSGRETYKLYKGSVQHYLSIPATIVGPPTLLTVEGATLYVTAGWGGGGGAPCLARIVSRAFHADLISFARCRSCFLRQKKDASVQNRTNFFYFHTIPYTLHDLLHN